MTPHPKPKTPAVKAPARTRRPRKSKRGRPPGSVKAPRQTVQARILTTTGDWLRQQHPSARTLHHAAALALDQLASQVKAPSPKTPRPKTPAP